MKPTMMMIAVGLLVAVSGGGSNLDGQGRQPRTTTRAAAPRLSAIDRDAADFVRAKVDSHWVKSADGWTTQLQERNIAGEVVPDYGITPNPLYKQYRDLTFTVEREAVTEAQRLNGADYRGRVSFRRSPVRFYRTEYDGEGPKGWSLWTDNVLYNLIPTLAVERRNGRWLIENSDLFDGLKPDSASNAEGTILTSMKFDLRNLVTAEEAYFADHVKYTADLGTGFTATPGNSAPRITLVGDGWTATIQNPKTRQVCAIYINTDPIPPATKEGAPACR